MCRIYGCVARTAVSSRHELLEAENPMIRQSETHDSGWGMAVYPNGEGEDPQLVRFPQAAYADDGFGAATEVTGRIFNVHVRRATMGGLTLENTHPFCLGPYSLSHNGTILDFPQLIGPGVAAPRGQTDTEHLFNRLMRDLDPGNVVASLRRLVRDIIDDGVRFSGLNVLFSDGERLYAYRLGIFELHWLARGDRLLVASERLTGERWHSVEQDVVLTLDPTDPDQPRARRLVGDAYLGRARIEEYEAGVGLRGAERGRFAAERAAAIAAGA